MNVHSAAAIHRQYKLSGDRRDVAPEDRSGEGDLSEAPLGSYDLIWVGPLFPHLRFGLAAAWIERLCSCLTPDGLVVATFHGRWSLEVHEGHPLLSETRFGKALAGRKLFGWGYSSCSGADGGDFGISSSTPSEVPLASTIPDVGILSFTERGWAGNHDVLVPGRPGRLEPWN